MGWTNETPHYNLPQFVDDDKPTWRGDVNYGFAQIDSALDDTPTISATRFGMAVDNTGAENKAALLAAHFASNGERAVFIPQGTYDLNPITGAEFGAHAPRLVGAGCRVLTTKRWDVGSSQWDTDGPQGTVLRCATVLGANQPFIHIAPTDSGTSASLEKIGLLGTGVGIGLRAGDDVLTDGGGHPVRWNFTDLTVANFDMGMTHTGENGVLVAPYIVGCGIGFYAGYPWNGNTVIGINIERVSRCAIKLNHAITNVFIGGVLQASYPTEATIVVENSSQSNIFDGIYCENYAPTPGGKLYEVFVGNTGGGTCYANKFRNMQFGAQTGTTTECEIVVYNATFTEIIMDFAASGTIQPTLNMRGGWGHVIQGQFPNVIGAAAESGRSRITTGASSAAGVTELYAFNLATKGFLRAGNALTAAMPNATNAGNGAIHRDQQARLLMVSEAGYWEPVVTRIRPFSNASAGALDLGPIPSWRVYTHLKLMSPTVTLWPYTDVSPDRTYHIRNNGSGTMTLKVPVGAKLNGVTDATVTVAPGNSVIAYVATGGSGWETV